MLAISITFAAALAVLAIIWHIPKQSALESLDTIPNVLSIEANRNLARFSHRLPELPSSRSKVTNQTNNSQTTSLMESS